MKKYNNMTMKKPNYHMHACAVLYTFIAGVGVQEHTNAPKGYLWFQLPMLFLGK